MRSRLRALVAPGISTLVMLALLIGLGVWQLERLQWKLGLLAQIDAAESHPSVKLTDAPSPFAKVSAVGILRGDREALYGSEVRETRDGTQIGAQLVVPLTEADGTIVLVDRGWVPDARPRPIDMPTGTVTIEGYIRAPDRGGMFSATDDVQMRRFYTLDPAAIGAALGYDHVAPFTLVALGTPPPAGYPDPARRLPRPPNDHLQYAITWFGLAVTLLVIFVVYARKVLRP